MSNLKSTIEDLAIEFASSIIGALRAASIDEITNVTGHGAGRGRSGRGGGPENGGAASRRGRAGKRLGRRSVADIGRMVDSIVTLLQDSPDGLRAEQIREALSCQAKELPRPLSDGLAQGRIKKTGQKRATTYFSTEKGGDGAAKRRARGRRPKRG
jgi:hypothetical protein